jgi:hypothetical protein
MRVKASDVDSNAVIKQWPVFRDSMACKFIQLWLGRKIAGLHIALENCAPAALTETQGMIKALRNVQALFEQRSIDEAVNDTVSHSKIHG